ncbi:MAG: hypothetical protein IKF14_13630 [Atopobiaceae bacterium]|nr:hypothetical protein [Atopobiaceae bacterium]
MKTTIERYTCDKCGKEIDQHDINAVISSRSTYETIPVFMHDPAYDEGYRDFLGRESIDLCAECARKSFRLHGERCRDEDGNWHIKYSWMDE